MLWGICGVQVLIGNTYPWHLVRSSSKCLMQAYLARDVNCRWCGDQGSTAPSKPPGAEPFAPAGLRPAGGCPRDFGHLAKFRGGVAPCKFSSERGQPPDFRQLS